VLDPPLCEPLTPELAPPPTAELLAPAVLAPELPLPATLLWPLPSAAPAPAAFPLVARAPLRLDDEAPSGPDEENPWAPAAPEDPPGPLLPVVARPDALAGPDAADEPATADVAAPDADPPLPVEPEDSLVVCEAGPDGPDVPPAPLPETLLDVGLELEDPVVPPLALAPVSEAPLLPDEALPVALPVEPPLDPPVEVPVAGPLLPLPVEVPVPLPDVEPDAAAVDAGGGGGAGAGALLRAATNARLEIRPVTPGYRRRSRSLRQPLPRQSTIRLLAGRPRRSVTAGHLSSLPGGHVAGAASSPNRAAPPHPTPFRAPTGAALPQAQPPGDVPPYYGHRPYDAAGTRPALA
jgi:hypothetical protein